MFSDLLRKTDKEHENLKIFQKLLAEQKLKESEENQRQQTEFYEDFELELFDAERTQPKQEKKLSTGNKSQKILSRNKKKTQKHIQQLLPSDKIINKWTEEDVQKLKENIKQVGLNINFLHILMPERTQNSIRMRIKLESPQEILELSKQCTEIPQSVKQVYGKISRKQGVLDVDFDLSDYENQREEEAGMEDEVREIVQEFEGW